MERLRMGLIVLAVSPLAWLVGSLMLDTTDYVPELALMIVGLGLAAWAVPAQRRLLGGIGFAVAALGLGLFYDFRFFEGLAPRAGGVVLLGLAVAAIAAWADTLRGMAAGLAVVAVGAAIWVRADWGVWEWQVGNALAIVGGAWSGVEAWRRD